MSFNVIVTGIFERKLKRLAKKYKSIISDLAPVIHTLAQDPTFGTSIGKDCYKIRIAIGSKGKGKSGGANQYIR